MRPKLVAIVSSVVAASAIAVAIWNLPGHSSPSLEAPLPPYALVTAGGEDGDGASGTPRIAGRAADVLSLLLRPAVQVVAPLTVRAAAARSGAVTAVSAPFRVSSTGSIEVRGTIRELAGDAPGDVVLVVLILRTGTEAELDAIAKGSAPPGNASVVRVPIRVLP